jgi:hypothetical protein
VSLRCPHHLEVYRFPIRGYLGDSTNFALNVVTRGLRIIASDGMGWDHVSVSLADRCPTWDEMEWVKRELWDPGDCVMQLHVPVADHKNCHPYCLHLWRPQFAEIPRPPAIMVAP